MIINRMTLAQRLNELAVANSEGLLESVSSLFDQMQCPYYLHSVTTNTVSYDKIYSKDSPVVQLCQQKLRLYPLLDRVNVGMVQLKKADVSKPVYIYYTRCSTLINNNRYGSTVIKFPSGPPSFFLRSFKELGSLGRC